MLLVVGLCFLVTGCGGGGSGESLSKAEFVNQGNAICRSATKEREEATKAGVAAAEGGGQAEAAAFTKALLAPVKKMTEELDALSPPKGEAKQVAAIVASLEAGIAMLEADPTSPKAATAFAKADKQVIAYGLTSCAI